MCVSALGGRVLRRGVVVATVSTFRILAAAVLVFAIWLLFFWIEHSIQRWREQYPGQALEGPAEYKVGIYGR